MIRARGTQGVRVSGRRIAPCQTISLGSVSGRRSATNGSIFAISTHSSRPATETGPPSSSTRTRTRTRSIRTRSTASTSTPTGITSPISRSPTRSRSPRTAGRRSACIWRKAPNCVLPKRSGPRSSPTPSVPSARRRTLSAPVPTRFSPAAAATRSSSTSTESRICSTSGANAISPSRISAANRRGRASTRTRRRTCFRPRSSCRRANSISSPRSMSGGAAA